MIPFFISVPHAGERVPAETPWLKGLPESVLMCDVDRYVDKLYGPGAEILGVDILVAETHRYVVDLNRVPTDVDADSVAGHANPSGKFTTGFHWIKTTTGATILPQPMTPELHEKLTEKYFNPFHEKVQAAFAKYKKQSPKVYHLDAHSMPSKGTAAHRDPGAKRPEIVVSDRDGQSCDPEFAELVIRAYKSVGFEVSYNWPYKGGRITETYGQPQLGQHTLQVEMNRSLYMDELSKKQLPDKFSDVQKRVTRAIATVIDRLRA